jgi:hypothetical protein
VVMKHDAPKGWRGPGPKSTERSVTKCTNARCGCGQSWSRFTTSETLPLRPRRITVALGISRASDPGEPPLWRAGALSQCLLGGMRRRGVGTRLIGQVHAVMCEHAQTTLTMMTYEADGHAFLRRIGAQEKISNIENRLRCDRLDEAQLAAWEKAAMASHQGPALEAYRGRVPLEVVEPLMPALSALHEDVRWGDLDHAPALLDISHYREWYGQLDRIGGAHHLVLLRESDGQLVVSEAIWDPRIPQRAWQLFTGIRRQWRRGGLAKCLKAVLLRHVREPPICHRDDHVER